ncbi:gamma-glutamylcyclotransferase [Paracoccus tegillarcae]|uniref:glutathione-specific gamma-glutamylcyclotransferase n=1 Tax=Paracoccus tegillarcae TaxID=1529068 RepID=A0A2K9EVH7_9RHOB|nr:gamma-glutamylcyclotransferase [Paracoccus tegillarcae]AUH34906.1 gamma-glutamylcyclotransferase [Paracoccus tegillarcae]
MSSLCWVFGYGSLMWDPGFRVIESTTARLDGYARSFCLRSTRYRGTAETPGLVLGLDADPDAHCTGIALRFAPEERDSILSYLRERELVTHAYREAILPIALEDGRRVEALTYVMRRDHVQYAGGLAPCEQARIISGAHGMRGPNADYLFNTTRHLAEFGMSDAALDALSEDVRRLLRDPADDNGKQRN